jgi:hypothetical protein
MKDEDLEKLSEIYNEKTDTWIWILSILILTLFNNTDKEKPIINIFLGDE